MNTSTKTQSLHSSSSSLVPLSLSLLHTKIVIMNSLILLLTIILLGCLTRMPLHSYPISLPISLILSLYKSHSMTLSLSLAKTKTTHYKSLSITYCKKNLYLLSICSVHLPMAASGFEGFEKRLELQFTGDDPMMIGIGLRRLDFESLQEVLDAVQCTVVSAMGNRYFDAYVLSESSLFVYPNKLIIKTCGTTQLLKSIPPMLSYAHSLGLSLFGCRYTRGSFIFPKAQPFPHTSFRDEVMYLDQSLPSDLCYRKACVMPSKKSLKHSWHVYSASIDEQAMLVQKLPELFTIEVCMTELDQVLARKFYQRMGDGNSGDVAGKEMTMLTGINEINPRALICDFAFDPCGYSMNGIDGEHYSTIHVTPEDGFSYASFECVGSNYDDDVDIGEVLKKVVQIFRPGVMSIALTSSSQGVPARARDAVEKLGLSCRSCTIDEFPVGGTIVFQTFSTRRK